MSPPLQVNAGIIGATRCSSTQSLLPPVNSSRRWVKGSHCGSLRGLLCGKQARLSPCMTTCCVCVCVCVCRHGWGRYQPEQWLRLGEAGGDWLHGRWGPPPALEPRQHSWPHWRRRRATPPPGPPLLPRCPGPGGQHLQRASVRVGRAADHPGAQRSGFRVRVGEPRAGTRLGCHFFFLVFPPAPLFSSCPSSGSSSFFCHPPTHTLRLSLFRETREAQSHHSTKAANSTE